MRLVQAVAEELSLGAMMMVSLIGRGAVYVTPGHDPTKPRSQHFKFEGRPYTRQYLPYAMACKMVGLNAPHLPQFLTEYNPQTEFVVLTDHSTTGKRIFGIYKFNLIINERN